MLLTNKPLDHPIHQRYEKGIEGQNFLKPLIENHLEEPIVFTLCQTDTMDAESEHYWIEIKRRFAKYHYTDSFILREGWLIPACKIKRARTEKKRVRFYYYWDSDESLWYWDYDERDLEGLTPVVPPWHRDGQLHYYLPQRVWSSV